MATETLHFENARIAQQLFNNDPKNLQALQDELDLKATAREGWIKLEGPTDAVERGKQIVRDFKSQISNSPRVPMTLADLVIGAECGGSDGTSGLAGNPG